MALLQRIPPPAARRTGAGKFRPSYLPEAADKIDEEGISKFETAAHDLAAAGAPVTYGLQQRQRPTVRARPQGQAVVLVRGSEHAQKCCAKNFSA